MAFLSLRWTKPHPQTRFWRIRFQEHPIPSWVESRSAAEVEDSARVPSWLLKSALIR